MVKIFPEHIRLPQWKKIKKIVIENDYVKSIFFKAPEISKKAIPGQFVLVYVFNYLNEDEIEEIPMGISYVKKETIGISVRKAGPTTKAIHKHLVNDFIGVRGPYGNGYKIDGDRIAVVGGGIGMAPLMPIVENVKKEMDVFLGAQSKNHLCFVKRIKNVGTPLCITTDDGSEGKRGFITEVLESKIKEQKYDQIITSGPEMMIKKVLDISNKYHIPLQAGIERYVKCGRGICGQCSINGQLVCKNGPVFDRSTLNKLHDFGNQAMDIAGEFKPIREVFNTRT